MDLVKNFDMDKIINFIREAIEFSRYSDKNNYIPEGGGQLNSTATPYGNLMIAGASMITMAGGIYVLSKKRK